MTKIGYRRHVNVFVPQNLLMGFRKRAKKVFPKEAYGILIGYKRNPNNFTITDIYYPENWKDNTTSDRVEVDDEWWEDASDEAGRDGCQVLGDIHSHPGYIDTAPSETDHNRFKRQYIQGILGIRLEKRNGVIHFKTRYNFWISGPVVHTYYTKAI